MTTERWEGDGLGPEDMAIPEIKLIQNVGGTIAKGSGAKPGDFYSDLTGEIIPGPDGFDLVVVAMKKNRTYWGRTEIEDEPPVCASMDAKSMRSIDGQDCSECEHRCETPWLLSATERRAKCLVNYNVLGILAEGQMPVLIRATGISAQSSKQLYTQISLNKELAGSWYKAKVHVTSVPKKSSSGDAFAIHFGKLTLIQDTLQLEELKIQSAQLLGTQILLPEGRPEDELQPLGFTPDGTPFYSEEERDRLMAPAPASAEVPVEASAKAPAEVPAEAKEKLVATPQQATTVPPEKEKKESTKKEPLDLDF